MTHTQISIFIVKMEGNKIFGVHWVVTTVSKLLGHVHGLPFPKVYACSGFSM